MQFGEAIDFQQSAAILSNTVEAGINFFDSAEMYPVPQRKETQGLSEVFVGRWLEGRKRDQYIIATKAAGPSGQMTYLRGGPLALDAKNISSAIDGSLQRLQTDYIDLYLLHWPDRYVPMFGESEYKSGQAYSSVPFEEQLEALSYARELGKIREFGLSNETAWGLTRFCGLSRHEGNWPKVCCLQNAYSLVCRTFDQALAECCHQEGVNMVAYSPLAMGLLTGKYREAVATPPSARLIKYKGRYAEAESRYGAKPNLLEAVEMYCKLADEAGMPPYELALRFVLSKPLIASAIIGVTSILQSQQLVKAAGHGILDASLLLAIDEIHQRFPNPAP